MPGLMTNFLAGVCLLGLFSQSAHHVFAAPAPATTDTGASDSGAPGYISDATSWSFAGAMLSVPRSSIASTSVGHLALFAGGRLQNDTYSDVVDIYNRRTNKWTTGRLSVPRSEVGAGSVAGRYALFAGGFDSSFRPMSLVDVYDAETGQWSTTNLNTPRAAPRILNLGETAVIIGGLSGDLQYLSRAIDYIGADLSIGNATLPSVYPQFGLAIADSDCGLGLFTSGYQNDKPGERFNDFQASNQSALFVTNTSSASFSQAPAFPSPRWGAGGAASNGLFAIGGGHIFGDGTTEPLTTVVDRVDLFSAATGQWSDTPLKLSVPRDYPMVQAVGDYIVFAGGSDKSKDFDILDTKSGTFIQGLQHRPALYTLRTDAAAVTVDNCLMIVAGGLVNQSRNTTASVEMFNVCRT
ncbi:hypothetical protein H4S07_001216 [Coemansia furcata]|uniref:Uncharacterized protein n=1 Tax=Coemansia furcata TaxID=417177 RepID=A0ACC1LQ49_9FUNG|nr:hypothetical protein H4S07_001216 [Coemansia furcata]